MGTALVTLPDGRKARVTFDTEEQLNSAIAELEKPAVVKAGEGIRDIPRQVGLAGRYAVEGALGLPATLANAAAIPMNAGLRAAGVDYQFPEQNQAVSGALTGLGLPEPQNPTERVVGDASRLVAGAGTMVGAAQKAAPMASGLTQRVLNAVATNPAAQAGGAVGAGAAGGSVREAGGGPWEQLAASLLGGVAGGLAVQSTQAGVKAAEAALKQALQPKEVAGKVQIAFERAGVDWGKLSDSAKAQLIDDAKAAVYSGQTLDDAAMRRLADYRNTGATPLTGDITQDPGLITKQRNLAKTQANMAPIGGQDLSQVQNQNAKVVINTLDEAAQSPLDAYGTGTAIMGKVQATDNAMTTAKNAAYTEARNAAGQDIPLSPKGFIDAARTGLDKELKSPYLPADINSQLDDIASGKIRFDVRTIDILKTNLAAASRKATNDGNARAALSIVRNALEDAELKLGQFGGQQVVTERAGQAMQQASQLPPEALRLLDKARKLAATQFKWQESAPFIEDALGGAQPDKFVQKHIIGGSVQNLAALRKLAGNDPILRDAVRAQLVGYIKARGGLDADVTKFSSAGLEKGLEAVGQRKLTMWFTPQEIAKIRSAVNVAKYSQSQPIGSAVNNSNSGAMIVGKVLDVIVSKSKLLPLGESLVSGPITNIRAGMDAKQLTNVGKALTVPQPRQPLPATALALGAAVPPSNQDRRK